MKSFITFLIETDTADIDYRGLHTPPMKGSGAPLHDLTGDGTMYPDDVYGPNAARHYGSRFETPGDNTHDLRLFMKIHALRNRPNAMVPVFRAVPLSAFVDGKQPPFRYGDWVTIHRPYAVSHGEGTLNGEYKIMRGMLPAKHLYTNGDSPYEYGIDQT